MANKRTESGVGRNRGSVKANKAKAKSNRAFYLLLAAIGIIAVAALGYSTVKGKAPATVNQYDSTLPPVAFEGYVLGSPQAPLEVTEFADFECPYCADFSEIVEPDVRSAYVNTGKIRLRFIDFPLPMHSNTWPAARSAACADEQGKFWEMHDLLYANQDRWDGGATSKPEGILKDLGHRIPGIDSKRFDKCVDTPLETQAKVQAQEKLAEDRQVASTPTFIIQGKQFAKALTFDEFKAAVDSALAGLDTTKKKAPPKK